MVSPERGKGCIVESIYEKAKKEFYSKTHVVCNTCGIELYPGSGAIEKCLECEKKESALKYIFDKEQQ